MDTANRTPLTNLTGQVDRFAALWIGMTKHYLQLNVLMTKEMILDFRRNQRE